MWYDDKFYELMKIDQIISNVLQNWLIIYLAENIKEK